MGNAKVFLLIAGLTALFGMVGGAIAGQGGALVALVIAGIMNFIAYFNSSTMVLKAYGAHTLRRDEAPKLYDTVDRLRRNAGLPMPTLAVAPQPQPNAFATGRNAEHAVVCVTQGLLQVLDQDELEGVLAHELGHIRNKDMLLQTVTASISGALVNLAHIGMYTGGRDNSVGPLAMILAPVAAMIMQFAISRTREFGADRAGAQISGKPLALASALAKLQAGANRAPMSISPAVAPIAQVNPLSALGGIGKLFSTHPPTEERIRRLQELARAAQESRQ